MRITVCCLINDITMINDVFSIFLKVNHHLHHVQKQLEESLIVYFFTHRAVVGEIRVTESNLFVFSSRIENIL